MPEPAVNDQLPPAPPPSAKPASDDALKRMETELQQNRLQMTELMKRISTSNTASPPLNAPTDAKSKKDLEKEFYANPLEHTAQIAKTVSEAIQQRAMQEMGGSFETLKEVARQAARSENPELFDRYALEIESKVAGTLPTQQTNIHVWKAAFNVIKGEHLNEVLASEREKAGKGNQAPALHLSSDGGPAPAGRPAAPAPAAAKLSDDEKSVARNLGLSDEQYAAGKVAYANQNVHGKSSWDGHITFDSREQRRAQREQRRNKPAA